jgi:hypothetical protein
MIMRISIINLFPLMLCVYIYIYIYFLIVVYLAVRPGVTAGRAAEMEVVAVPSIPKQSHLYTSADEVINSLLDLQPEKWGLPPFQDCKLLSIFVLTKFSQFYLYRPFLMKPLI